ncbi:alpha,alpha-phosphotrehalase [bacterium C-53]|nr:alpha,alpha-phosphotrehalase [Lachnospiraceae bacterium]NBI03647.1 alpha,alpha-phosphotrehalase [Lachnospiraceae bacterium]RKJ09409.1 alpha,alpha-phosphotrehalase [bacterium C-53]
MKDYKKSTIYQIYPKSFCDSNGDGIGDIRGIISKLDYIKSLGVDYIWSTPFFTSPLHDNGYDVENYREINPVFGTMEDVEELIAKAGERGIGIMLDMVFNHTSTQHEWFQKALKGDKTYMDYYIFKDGTPDTPPTNWQSKFGGSAWEYVSSLKKWYLHLFDTTQADLNWDNPSVREELKEILRFWMAKGVKGFRFDVVNLISKPEVLEDDETGDGRKFYSDGPHVHEYLKELSADTGMENYITVGEMSSTNIDHCIRYSNPDEKELSMCFNFHHLKVDYKDGDKWELMQPDYRRLKELFEIWQTRMEQQNGWNALFWCNHDQPRIVSRLGNEKEYWKESAKMLATFIHMLRGTPYIYQGEELGMTNPGYSDIRAYRDVESIHYYNILKNKGKTEQEALEILSQRSRDNGRSPMQWDSGKYAGFSEQEPWISAPENHTFINVEAEEQDKDSILNFYRKLISLRKRYGVIQEGTVQFIDQKQPELLVYMRTMKGQKLLVASNFSGHEIVPEEPLSFAGGECLICNYPQRDREDRIEVLRPYESIVLFCAEST